MSQFKTFLQYFIQDLQLLTSKSKVKSVQIPAHITQIPLTLKENSHQQSSEEQAGQEPLGTKAMGCVVRNVRIKELKGEALKI